MRKGIQGLTEGANGVDGPAVPTVRKVYQGTNGVDGAARVFAPGTDGVMVPQGIQGFNGC